MEQQSQPLDPDVGETIVRMYRHGLGDCYLIVFGARSHDGVFRLLIDCGVHSRQDDGGKRLLEVQQDILNVTGGHLNAVVITHEHADHLSGFTQRDSRFLDGSLTIGEAWLAWTERPGDAIADKLRKNRLADAEVMEAALERLRKRASSADKTVPAAFSRERQARFDRVVGQLDFNVPSMASHDEKQYDDLVAHIRKDDVVCADELERIKPVDDLSVAAAKKRHYTPWNQAALAVLRTSASKTLYYNPGDVIEPKDVPGIRLHVLGPPRDERLLKKDAPSRQRGAEPGVYRETYFSGGASPLAASAGLPGIATDLEPFERSPFADWAVVAASLEDLQKLANQDNQPGQPPDPVKDLAKSYTESGSVWRTIDDDWLDESEALALAMDSDTNNTSLVLAIEIGKPGEGDVLLFPGDAQVGNWLSWRDQNYVCGKKTQTADELLSRTRLYKVAHHASHNGTLKADARTVADGEPYGLELMNDIIAMINVDHVAAEKPNPHVWHMPHRPLYEVLRTRAERRVLRADDSCSPLGKHEQPDIVPDTIQWQRVPGVKHTRWRRAKKKFEAEPHTALYYDVHFRPARSVTKSKTRGKKAQ